MMLMSSALAGVAMAQPRGLLDIKVSLDGVNWANHVDGGQRVHVGVFMSVEGAYGVAGAEFNIVLNGIRATDTVDISSSGLGRQLPWNFGSSTQAVYRSGNQVRIDAANDDANSADRGIVSQQRDPSSGGVNYSTANPGLVYKFDVIFGSLSQGEGFTIAVEAAMDEIKGGVMSYHSSSSATRSATTTNLSTQGASISRGVPTPGAASAFGMLGMIVAARRRRPVSALSAN